MIKPEQIPDEAVRAFKDKDYWSKDDWQRKCIAAAINAWPEVKRVEVYFTDDTNQHEPAFILPLPQEKSND